MSREPHRAGQWHSGHSEDSDGDHRGTVQWPPSCVACLQHSPHPGWCQGVQAACSQVWAILVPKQHRRHGRGWGGSVPETSACVPETSGKWQRWQAPPSSLPRIREACRDLGPTALWASPVEAPEAWRRFGNSRRRRRPTGLRKASGQTKKTEQRLLPPSQWAGGQAELGGGQLARLAARAVADLGAPVNWQPWRPPGNPGMSPPASSWSPPSQKNTLFRTRPGKLADGQLDNYSFFFLFFHTLKINTRESQSTYWEALLPLPFTIKFYCIASLRKTNTIPNLKTTHIGSI